VARTDKYSFNIDTQDAKDREAWPILSILYILLKTPRSIALVGSLYEPPDSMYRFDTYVQYWSSRMPLHLLLYLPRTILIIS